MLLNISFLFIRCKLPQKSRNAHIYRSQYVIGPIKVREHLTQMSAPPRSAWVSLTIIEAYVLGRDAVTLSLKLSQTQCQVIELND